MKGFSGVLDIFFGGWKTLDTSKKCVQKQPHMNNPFLRNELHHMK